MAPMGRGKNKRQLHVYLSDAARAALRRAARRRGNMSDSQYAATAIYAALEADGCAVEEPDQAEFRSARGTRIVRGG